MLLTGDEANVLSWLFQLVGAAFVVFGVGITGFCAPIAFALPHDDEKRWGKLIAFACIFGAVTSLFRPQVNSLFRFEYASLLVGTFLYLAQFVVLSWLLRLIATRFEQHELAERSKRLVPWLIATWVLPHGDADFDRCVSGTPQPRRVRSILFGVFWNLVDRNRDNNRNYIG